MTPEEIEKLKREVGDKLSALIPNSYSDNTMLNTIDYLAAQGYLGAQWLPIESAPKDGKAILVCYDEHYENNGFLPVCVRWRNYHPNAQGKEDWRDSSGHKISVATHWMPLPQPPKAGE